MLEGLIKVIVFEDDRITQAGVREFISFKKAQQFATLNQPALIYFDGRLLCSYGMEDEE